MTSRSILCVAALLAASSIQAQTIALRHFVPAANTLQIGRFSCNDASGGSIDAETKFGMKKGGDRSYESGVYEISFEGEPVDARTLAKIAGVVAGATVESVSGQCQDDGRIQLIFGLWRPLANGGEGTRDSVIVLRGKDRAIEVVH